MNKTMKALLCVVVLLFGVALVGEYMHRGDELKSTTALTEEATAKAVVGTTRKETTTSTTTKTTTATSTTVPEQTTGSNGTFTGLFALPPIRYTVPDPDNRQGLSTECINHSFGIAKDGKPHSISVDNQNRFDRNGQKAIAYDNKTTEKVLYLTFDSGYENGCTGKILDTLKEKNVPAAFFCTKNQLLDEPALVSRMIREGHIVGNHSDTHPNFSKISRTKMAKELESTENVLREKFGYSSTFFRFPEGAYNDSALDLVGSLGYTSVFWSVAYADWDVSNTKGADYATKTVIERLHPGAIILLHSVSPDNAAAMADIIDTARAMGYTFRSLRDFGK